MSEKMNHTPLWTIQRVGLGGHWMLKRGPLVVTTVWIPAHHPDDPSPVWDALQEIIRSANALTGIASPAEFVARARKQAEELAREKVEHGYCDAVLNAAKEHIAKLETLRIEDNKAYGCELKDPNGTIWQEAKRLQTSLAAAIAERDAMAKVVEAAKDLGDCSMSCGGSEYKCDREWRVERGNLINALAALNSPPAPAVDDQEQPLASDVIDALFAGNTVEIEPAVDRREGHNADYWQGSCGECRQKLADHAKQLAEREAALDALAAICAMASDNNPDHDIDFIAWSVGKITDPLAAAAVAKAKGTT